MRYLIVVGVVVLLGLVGAFMLGFFEPSGHTDYALQKQLQGEPANRGIIWHAIPVDKAYDAVARQRTPYRSDIAKASRDEVDYLSSLFALTDAALAERVAIQLELQSGEPAATQLELQSGEPAETDKSNYDDILSGILALKTPGHLVPVEALIFQAISEQRAYLDAWRKSGQRLFFDRTAPMVESSHEKLTGAYDRLMEIYGEEEPHNKQALFDHLHALDFI